MAEAFLVDALRTPLGPSLAGGVETLAALPLQGLIDRHGLDPRSIDEVIVGSSPRAGVEPAMLARWAALLAGLPFFVPARSVHRGDAAGLPGLSAAVELVASGYRDLVLVGAAGVPQPAWAPLHERAPAALRWNHGFVGAAEAADIWCRRLELDADALTELAQADLARALQAVEDGELDEEIVPSLDTDGAWHGRDLPQHTVGAAPEVAGAAAVLVASDQALADHGLKARARVVGQAASGVDPTATWGGGIVAGQRVLAELAMGIDEVDLFELDAPFRAVGEGHRRDLGVGVEAAFALGSPGAFGRPPGASGLRSLVSLLGALERRDLRFGLASVDSVDGQGTAVLLDRAIYS